MSNMNPGSEAVLAPCHPLLAVKVRTVYNNLLNHNPLVVIHVFQGVRTYEQQNAEYAKGRTAPGPVVTNAPGGFSSHNFGLAVDLAPGVIGSSVWRPDWNWADWDFQLVIASCKAVGLAWGGDWKTMKGDYDHFYLPDAPANPTPQMRSDYAEGGLPYIYSQYDKGAYKPL